MLTLFQVLTLEGWNDILNTQYHGSDIGYDEGWKQLTAEANRVSIGRPIAASAYFVSFILIGTMIILNVFTGVIIRSMESAEEAAKLERRLARGQQPRQDELRELSEQLQSIAQRLGEIEQESSASSAGGTLVAPGLAMAAPDRH
jgi:voltage-gated sodium channel